MTVYGMPIGPPSQRPEPKSALSRALEPIVDTQVDEEGWTGRPRTSACQNESAGVTAHPGAPVTGVPTVPGAQAVTVMATRATAADSRTAPPRRRLRAPRAVRVRSVRRLACSMVLLSLPAVGTDPSTDPAVR